MTGAAAADARKARMSITAIGLLGVGLLLVLIFLRVPIAIALAACGFLGYAAIDGWKPALKMAGHVPYQMASAYSLSVIPLFILMGTVALARQHGERAVPGLQRGVLRNPRRAGKCDHRRLHAVRRDLRLLDRDRRDLLARSRSPKCAGTAMTPPLPAARWLRPARSSVLIPPSVLTAIYSIVAEQSLVKLYAAAFVPGFVLAALYVVTVWIVAWVKPHWIPQVDSMPLRVRLKASLGMWKLGVLFFFAVFGIYLGWFSPTEAAAIAAFVAILIAFATRAMNFRDLIDCMLETVYTTASIFFSWSAPSSSRASSC